MLVERNYINVFKTRDFHTKPNINIETRLGHRRFCQC